MKNIINWTLGGFFRSIGRILSFLVIGLIIGLIVAKSGLRIPTWLSPLYIVKADTVNYTYKQYRVQYYSLGQGTTAWNSWTSFGTSTPLSEGYGVSSLAVRFGQSNDFTTGNTYRIVIDSGFSPQSEKQYIGYSGSSCYGSSSTTSWNNVEIADCQYIGMADTPNSVHRKFVFDVTPSVNYKGLQININFSGTAEIRGVNVYSSSTISTGPDITGAIDEQTLIIEDGFQDITNIINQTNENLINAITEQNQVCEMIDRNNTIQSGYLTSSGEIASSSAFKITDYIKIDNNSKLTLLETYTAYNTPNICFYNTNKTLISCVAISTIQQNANITIPNNSSYVRISINYDWNRPQLKLCKNGNQATLDTLTDTDTSSDSDNLGSFFSDFTLSIEGPISQIVLLPLDLLNVLIVDYNSNETHPDICTTFKGQQICLPSGDLLWHRSGCHDNGSPWFPCTNVTPLKNFLQLVVGGFIIYKLLRRLVASVEKGLDPASTRVDMMKL